MDFPLQPVSEAGRKFVALCEAHEQAFFSRADENDPGGMFPRENIEDAIKSGVIAATVPEELGGIGVVSLRDHAAGMTRLGRGDGSTAIALNMHLYRVWGIARAWRAARITGADVQAAALGAFLQDVAAGRSIISVLLTESGTDLLHPMTEATRHGDGWLVSGHKTFSTGVPAANLLGVTFRMKDEQGDYRTANAYVRKDNPAVDIRNNWDAVGMRGSGSHDVVFKDCFVPNSDVTDLGPWGELTPRFLLASIAGVMGLAAAFLGIAEAARNIALKTLAARGQASRYAIRHLVAEMEIDLATARATLERAAAHADALLEGNPVIVPLDDLQHVAKDFQCAKWFVTRKAVDIVDRALTASGGSGYLSRNPLSRLYRDVRAGPFMQPFSPNEAFDFIGGITLGQP